MSDQVSRADLQGALAEIRQQVAAHWGWFLALGLVLVVAGIAAIAFPLLSTVAVKIALGWVFLVGGIVMIVHAFSASHWHGLIWEVLLGALYAVAGAYLAFFPLTGIITLTILLAALFIVEGGLEISLALRVRPHEGWGWLLVSGLIAVAVGLLIALGLPSSAAWAIGLLAGINLISTGWGFLFLALAGRRAAAAMATR
jgi:uncharacterized membrane protein HdeD (DUF308 family)